MKDPCTKKFINHSKVSALLSEELMKGRDKISRTEIFDEFARMSEDMEQYYQEVTMTKGQLTKLIKMFFNKHMVCMELDNIFIEKV